jgi:hypothetical protein
LEKFTEFLAILKSLLIQIPILNIGSDNQSNDEVEDQPMQTDQEVVLIDTSIIVEILKIFDSKQLTDKIEATLNDISNDEKALKDFCLSVSYICNFILLNSNTKIHKTL